MANILTYPLSAIIAFSDQAAGASTVPALTEGPRIAYNDVGGLQVQSQVDDPTDLEVFGVEGSKGNLMSVNDTLTGSVFTVSDSAGMPLFNIDSTTEDVFTMGTYGEDWFILSASDLYMKDGNILLGVDAPSPFIDGGFEVTPNARSRFGLLLNDTDGERAVGFYISSTGEGSQYIYSSSETLGVLLRGGGDSYVGAVGGNFGVGTTTPGSKLDVVGSATISGDLILKSPDTTSAIVQATNDDILTVNAKTPTVEVPTSFDIYQASPDRQTESNIHGGINVLDTGSALNSGSPINVSKGIGKIMIVVNAGTDLSGTITVTGETIDRNTGASTPGDTDTITVDALTTDASTTDSNGHTLHDFTGAYITSKWFTGAVTISTTDLTLTDVDTYHVSFEQSNDAEQVTLKSLDVNLFTTNAGAEFDCYLYTLEVTGDKCDIDRQASLNIGADGETAIVDRYWRLRRGNINKVLNGTTDGAWVDVYYANSPAYVEDVTLKIWATTKVPVQWTS